MISWKHGLAAALALAPLAVLSITHGEELLAGIGGKQAQTRTGNVAGQRDAILADMTLAYVAQGSDVTGGMRNGEQLAPIAYLNERLAADGHKWRVDSAEGMFANTIDVS